MSFFEKRQLFERFGGTEVRLRSLFERVGYNTFLRSVALLASATAAGQFLALLATPLLTRLYSPKEFGLFAVFNALFAVMMVGSSLRYEMAIPLPKRDADARILVAVSLALNLIIALISLIVFLAFGHLISNGLRTPELEPFLPLISIVLVGGGSFKALTFWSVRKATFENFAKAKLGQAIANVSIQIAAGYAGFGLLGLVIGQFFGYTAGTTKLFRSVGFSTDRPAAADWSHRALVLVRHHIRFPLYDAPAALINVVSTQLPSLLLAMLFGPSIAGFYMLADRVLSTPASLLAQAIGQVLFSRSKDEISTSNLEATASKITIQLIMLTLPAILIMFFGGQYLFALIFGKNWVGAGSYACWLSIGMGPLFVYGSISLLLPATGGQTLNLYIQTGLLLLKGAAMGVGAYVNDPLALIICYSIANALGYSVALVLVLRHLRSTRCAPLIL